MDLRLLRYFVAVAEELHFTRAAARLHMAQPALSHQIRVFERTLGFPLFQRSNRWVRLTDAGAALLPEARSILERADAAVRLAARAASGEVGTLTVGFTASSSGDLLPTAVLKFRKRFPDVEIRLRLLLTRDQVAALLADELDVGLVHGSTAMPASLRSVLLRRERFMVGLPAGHRLTRQKSLTLTDLAKEPFIGAPGYAGNSLDPILVACEEAGFTPRLVQRAPDSASLLVLVASGLGITVLPESSGHIATTLIVYRPLRGQPSGNPLYAAWKPSRGSALATAFVAALKQSL